MTADLLLRAFSGVGDDLLTEYDHYRPARAFRPMRLAALAACVAVAAGAALWARNAGTLPPVPDPAPGPAPSGDVLPGGAPIGQPGGQPQNAEDPADDHKGGWSPAELTPEQEAAGEAALSSARLGPLFLGMSADELRALYGEPDQVSNSGPVTDADGNQRICWWYDLEGGNAAYSSDVKLDLADAGEGWFLNEIYLYPECALTLDTGVGIGSGEDAMLAAYPALALEQESRSQVVPLPGSGGAAGPVVTTRYYVLGAPGRGLSFSCEDGAVTGITLGMLLPWPVDSLTEPSDPPADSPAPEYSFSGATLTVWSAAADGWQARAVTGERDKKYLEVLFNITEPEGLDSLCGAEIARYVDFGGGTAAGLCACGSDEGYIFRYEGDFSAALESGGLEVRATVRFPAGVWAATGE